MTKREIVATIIAAILVFVSMYQCGASQNDRALKQAATDSLAASVADRARLSAQLTEEQRGRARDLLERDSLERWSDSVAAVGRIRKARADSLGKIVAAHQRQITDTTTKVPVGWFNNAVLRADEINQAYEAAEAARVVLADSVRQVNAAIQRRIVTAVDSVKAVLAREATRAPVIGAGIAAGSDRCGWGPWKMIPCVTRKVAFVGGVVAGAVTIKYGDKIVDFTKTLYNKKG